VSLPQETGPTDSELLDKFRKDGDNRWLGILLQRYTLLLFGLCMKYMKDEELARDCVQQIFFKALTEIPKYEITQFRSWLYTIGRNHCLMQLRSKGRMTKDLTDQLAGSSPIEEQEEKWLESLKDQQIDLLPQALETLPQEQQICITLFYLQRKSYQEVIAITGYNHMQVKSYIQNGKRNLRIQLQKNLRQP